MNKCPDKYNPGCSCYTLADEPNPNCWVHGYPNPKQCPYCGQFRKYTEPCKRCGCDYGLPNTEEQ